MIPPSTHLALTSPLQSVEYSQIDVSRISYLVSRIAYHLSRIAYHCHANRPIPHHGELSPRIDHRGVWLAPSDGNALHSSLAPCFLHRVFSFFIFHLLCPSQRNSPTKYHNNHVNYDRSLTVIVPFSRVITEQENHNCFDGDGKNAASCALERAEQWEKPKSKA